MISHRYLRGKDRSRKTRSVVLVIIQERDIG